jgi:hypothetical protein
VIKSASAQVGNSWIRCKRCRQKNLGIDIWCSNCGSNLDLEGEKAQPAAAAASIPGPARPAKPIKPARPAPSIVWPKPDLSLLLARVKPPAIKPPAIKLPTIRLPKLGPPSTGARTLMAVALLLILAPLAFVTITPRISLANPLHAASNKQAHLPKTPAAAPGQSTALEAAIQGVESKTGLKFQKSCAPETKCLSLLEQKPGANAATVHFATAAAGAGRACLAYVYQDGAGWHYLDSVCGLPDYVGPMVGRPAVVFIDVDGQCANVRKDPGLNAAVVACLAGGKEVKVDGGPNWVDGKLWWHVQNGWMAHEVLKSA